jgi:UDP-glucose 4-epimerase
MRVFVTGSEGFLGTNLCGALDGHDVVRWDKKFGHTLDLDVALLTAVDGCDAVIHLAANADVRDGWSQPRRDLHDNTQATSNLLEAMRHTHVKRILFASSSAMYGDAPLPTPESWFGQQTSLYGASKLACEGLLGAYAAAGHVSATVLRLTSMLGPHYRHGLVKDFVETFQTSLELTVLGGGSVARTRMDVSDGVAAFLHRLPEDPGFEVFNVGTDETITSLEVAFSVAEALGVEARIGTVGESWVGDHPILLDCARLRATGWAPKFTIEDGIHRTVDWLTRGAA